MLNNQRSEYSIFDQESRWSKGWFWQIKRKRRGGGWKNYIGKIYVMKGVMKKSDEGKFLC